MFELEGKGGTKINYSLKDKKVVIIGRGAGCDLQLESEKLSRKHCILRIDGNKVSIEDLGSKNGVRINGRKIKNTVEIAVGDEIGFSDAFTFVLRGPAAPAAQAPIGENTPEESKFGQAFAEIHAPEVAPAASHLPAVVVQPGDSLTVPQADLHPAKVGSKDRSKTLLYAIGVVGIIFVLALLMRGKDAAKSGDGTIEDANLAYAKLLDGVVDRFEHGKFASKENEADLAKAIGLVADNGTAFILRDLAKLHAEASGNYERLNWVDAKRLTGELIDARPKTPKMERWAHAKMAELVEESQHVTHVMQMRQHVAAENWPGVLESFKQIPDDCKFKKIYQGQAEGARQILSRNAIDAAKKAFAQAQWAEAMDLYEKSKAYAAEDELLFIQGFITKAESHKINQDHLTEAKNLMKSEDFVAAMEAAAWVEKDSIYFAEADKIRESARVGQMLAEAKKNYDSGQAEKAIELLKGHADSKSMVTKIGEVVKNMKMAGNAIQERELDKALGLWNTVIQLEASEKNHYRVEAQNSVAQWGSPKKLAVTYKEWGDEAFQAKKYKTARTYYEKAKNHDAALVEKAFDDMKKLAFHYFNTGYNMKDLNRQKTLEYLKQVIELLPPDDRMYMESEKLIEKIGDLDVSQDSSQQK